MWISQTYGKLNFNEIPEKLHIFYENNKHYGEPIEIAIGTDSQNHNCGTKIVTVISIICRRHGGIFFHNTLYKNTISIVKEKLETETNISLETAQALLDYIQACYPSLFENCPVSIHIDAGNAPHGKTKDLIQALTGWVHAMGYDCEIKPNSYSASSVADRLSK